MSIDRLRDGLSRWLEDVVEVAERDIADAAEVAERVAKLNAPVRTGRLQRGIEIVQQGRKMIDIRTEAPYTAYQEFGTRFIRAKGFLKAGLEAAIQLLVSRGYTRGA